MSDDIAIHGSRGMALIAVLWIVSLLAILAAGIGSSGQTNARLAFNAVEKMKARAAADAGVHRAIFELLTGDAHRTWPKGGLLDYRSDLDGAQVGVQVRDEDGKIDLNVASRSLLRNLLRDVGVADDQAMGLARRIVEYREGDDRQPSSAPGRSDHQALGRRSRTSGEPFRSVEQLEDLPGMTPALFRRILPHVTVYSGAEGIDPLRASATAFRAVANMSPERDVATTSSTEAETAAPAIDPPDWLASGLGDMALPSRELMFAIQASAESDGGGRFVREAIVAVDGGRYDLPVTIHLWRQGR